MNKIGIITAMGEEAIHIIDMFALKEVKKFSNITIYENGNIILAFTGIGKIQSTIGTTYLLENYKIDKLINIGIAGSLLGNEVMVGDVFLVTKITQHDMYLPFEGKHLDYAKKDIIIKSDIKKDFSNFPFNVFKNSYSITGDQFIDDSKKVLDLKNKYNADIVEMEAFAVASVAREYGILDNCIFIKAVSDGADNDAIESHMGNLDFAMKNSLEVLKELL